MAGTDFLGAMVVDIGYRATKNKNQMKAVDEKITKNWVEGKMNSQQIFIVLRNMSSFAATKDPTLQRSLPTQRLRELCRDVLEDLARATQRSRVLRCCVTEAR